MRRDAKGFGLLVHLGDVYYSGTEKEIRERFLEYWPRIPGAVSRACNSNHEMYTGGHGYFKVTLPEFGQPSSCFALANDNWLIVGLDSAYHDFSFENGQIAWLGGLLENAGNRRVILLSHHQPFSLLDSQGPKLVGALSTLLNDGRIFAWYWGHEHRCVVYDAHPLWSFHGRCIGHGGYPYFREVPIDATLQTHGQGFDWYRLKGKNLAPAGLLLDGPNPYVEEKPDRYGPNGYAVLELNGSSLEEIYCDADGRELLRRKLI